MLGVRVPDCDGDIVIPAPPYNAELGKNRGEDIGPDHWLIDCVSCAAMLSLCGEAVPAAACWGVVAWRKLMVATSGRFRELGELECPGTRALSSARRRNFGDLGWWCSSPA